jgi:hypothetical protein
VAALSYVADNRKDLRPFKDMEVALAVITNSDKKTQEDRNADAEANLIFLASIAQLPWLQERCRIVTNANPLYLSQDWFSASHGTYRGLPGKDAPLANVKLADWIGKYSQVPPATDVRRIRELCNALPLRPIVPYNPPPYTPPEPPPKSTMPPLAQGEYPVAGKGTSFAF